jgi:hypothetical protein
MGVARSFGGQRRVDACNIGAMRLFQLRVSHPMAFMSSLFFERSRMDNAPLSASIDAMDIEDTRVECEADPEISASALPARLSARKPTACG